MVTVDGTDFRICEPSPFSPKWYSHKFKGPGLRYEVAISINGGDIVHVYGPFPCGAYPDISIFRRKLIDMLVDGEMVEADRGYRGEPNKVRIPVDYFTKKQKKMKSRARARQETCNRRFKQFGVLGQRFRHGISKHKIVFESVAVITQLEIDNGAPLFHVDYY